MNHDITDFSSSNGEETSDGGDEGELPTNETVRLITGITRVMHTPEVVEGETSSTGKTISVEHPTKGGTTYRLDTAEILDGESEFRDATYFEIYTPKRLQKCQRANKAPGPRAGCNGVSDAGDLPDPTHVPAGEDPYPKPDDSDGGGEDDDDSDSNDGEDATDWRDMQTWSRADVFAVEGVGELLFTRLKQTRTSPPTTTGAEAVDREGNEWTVRTFDAAGPEQLVVENAAASGAVVGLDEDTMYPGHAVEYVGRDLEWLREYIGRDRGGD